MVSQRMEEFESLIRRIPGVMASILRSHSGSYADSLFVDSISFIELHRKITFLKMKPYDAILQYTIMSHQIQAHVSIFDNC